MTTAPFPDPSERPGVETDAAARAADLFERHGRMVYGVCRAMLRDVHDAEDATQQAFLSAYRALLGGARVRDAGAWLATIARNECRARIAAGMRTPLPLADEDLAAIPAPTDETERRLQADELRNAFAELPERQREAVVLRDLYGLRYGEVATALGLSRAATEALLFRARRAMRVHLRPVAGAVLAVPLAVREELASAIPGFAASGGGGAAAVGTAGAVGGLLAKLTATPVGIKVATVAVAATTVGVTGSLESDRPVRGDSARAPFVTSVDSRLDDSGDDGHGVSGGSGEGRDDDGGNPGSGDGDDDSRDEGIRDDDRSGPNRGPSGESGDDREDRAAEADDGGSSGPGSGDDGEPGDDDGSGDRSGSGSSDDSSGSSGSDDDSGDSSGSGSGSSGSSGSGSGSGDDSSGSGSGEDDEESDSSGSGSNSGSGGGSGDDDD